MNSPNRSINGLHAANTVKFVLERLQQNSPLRVELNTQGRDADAARRIAVELQLLQRHAGRPAVGKTNVYSAGITILAAFPKEARYLTPDTTLLVHERSLDAPRSAALIVTHTLAQASSLADRIVVPEGSPADIMRDVRIARDDGSASRCFAAGAQAGGAG